MPHSRSSAARPARVSPFNDLALHVARRWWRRHPVNAAGRLVTPVLARYARDEPAKLLATAAAVGALAVLVRPWRLLSLTAVAALALKTSDAADLVTSLMPHRTSPRKETE